MTRTSRPFVQGRPFSVLYVADLGFSVPVSKAVVLTSPYCPVWAVFRKLYFSGALLPRVSTYRYLGATVDSRLTWRPHVTDLSPRCARMTSIVRKIRGLRWVPSPSDVLCVHRGISMSRIFCLEPYLPFLPHYRNNQSSLHRISGSTIFPNLCPTQSDLYRRPRGPVRSQMRSTEHLFICIVFLHLQVYVIYSAEFRTARDLAIGATAHPSRKRVFTAPVSNATLLHAPWEKLPVFIFPYIPGFRGIPRQRLPVCRVLGEDVSATPNADITHGSVDYVF